MLSIRIDFRSPFRYIVRPQSLVRLSPLPSGHATALREGISRAAVHHCHSPSAADRTGLPPSCGLRLSYSLIYGGNVHEDNIFANTNTPRTRAYPLPEGDRDVHRRCPALDAHSTAHVLALARRRSRSRPGAIGHLEHHREHGVCPGGIHGHPPDQQGVLVTGGRGVVSNLASVELYDPVTGTWSPTGDMNSGRTYHTATLLPNGQVLVAGGYDLTSELASAELHSPTTSSADAGPRACLAGKSR
jgi:hypothetical protein